MEKLAVLGAGVMGHSIALSVAWAGFEVALLARDDEEVVKANGSIKEKLYVLYQNELISEPEINEIIARINTTVSLDEAIQNKSYIIEAIPEDLELKQDFFEMLGEKCSKDVILGSNTSGLSPTAIAARTKYPERVVVVHFWNPAHLIPLVEVVKGNKTDDETVQRSMNLLRQLNKKPIEVKKEVPGFVGNRLQYALYREAQYIYEQGIASIEDIDAAVMYSIGRRLPVTGPFMTADMGGLDVFDSISNYLFEDLCDATHSLDSAKKKARDGDYGQKSGKGFYAWDSDFSKKMNEQRENQLIHFLKKDELL